MKIITLLLLTILSCTNARPTFGKIAEVLLNVLTGEEKRQPYQYPPNHAGYQQGYHQQYHYGGGESSGYSNGGVIGGYPNNGYYQQPSGNPYGPQFQSGVYPNGNYAAGNGYYGQPLQSPPYSQYGYQNQGY